MCLPFVAVWSRKTPATSNPSRTPRADAVRFFSNRRAFKQGEPDYGRLLSAIVLEG